MMRYAHHHPESLRAGAEILDRVPTEVSTNSAQSGEGTPSLRQFAISTLGVDYLASSHHGASPGFVIPVWI